MKPKKGGKNIVIRKTTKLSRKKNSFPHLTLPKNDNLKEKK